MSRRLAAPPEHVRALVPPPEVEWTEDGYVVFSGPSGPAGWHARQLRAECMQKAAYSSLVRIEPVESRRPLIVGSLVHQGVAQHWARVGDVWGRDAQGQPIPAPSPLATPEQAMRWMAPRLRAERAFLELAVGVVAEYLSAIGDPESAKPAPHVLGVEVRLSTTIGGRAYTQRADRIVWRDGGVWIVDTKTTGRIEAKAVKGWSMSGQFSGYRLLGARHFGGMFRGCVIERLQLEPFRYQSVNAGSALGMDGPRFEQSVTDHDDRWEALVASGRDPWNFPKTMSEIVCMHRYGACEYMELCRHGKAALGGFVAKGAASAPPSARGGGVDAPATDDDGFEELA